MGKLSAWRGIAILLLLAISPSALADPPRIKPGKGLTLLPGDFAEYTNVESKGEKTTRKFSTIMIALGGEQDRERVMLMQVRNDKLTSRSLIQYDLTKAGSDDGELLDSGKETLVVNGKKFECRWEKRGYETGTITTWKCPDLPFERYAKVRMEREDGMTLVTELIRFGPDPADEKGNEEFLKRLETLNAQADD